MRNKRKEFLKVKIDELETDSKITNIRGLYRSIGDFKKGCQLRINILRDKKGDLVTDSHSILARLKNHFSPLFNVQYMLGSQCVYTDKIHKI